MQCMIKYLSGDEYGGLGLAPWFQEGSWRRAKTLRWAQHPV